MEELMQLIEGTANMLRGMMMDPTIPVHAKLAMQARVAALDDAVSQQLDDEYSDSIQAAAGGMTQTPLEG